MTKQPNPAAEPAEAASPPAPPSKRLSLSQVLELVLSRGAGRGPSFAVERSATNGRIKISVDVPVCDEYPTADAAFDATVRYFDELAKRYPYDLPPVGKSKASS